MSDCAILETASSHWIPELIGALISTTLIVISLFFFDWRMTLAAVWVMPIAFIIVLCSRSVMGKIHEQSSRYRIACLDGIQEGLETLRDLRSYNMTDSYMEGLNKKIKAVESHSIVAEFSNALFVASAQMILKFGIGTVAVVGLSLIHIYRRAFQVELEEQIRKKEPGFFIFIDVDNFKSYNDTYGHNNGDLCLKHFTKAMQECFPEGSILSRYGGDEFVVYLKDVTKESVYIYMEKFQKMIADLTLATGEKVHLSASAGGAAFPEQGEDFISLCRSADAALYNVKQNGKGAFKIK